MGISVLSQKLLLVMDDIIGSMARSEEVKRKLLLEEKKKIEERIEKLKEMFLEEKSNEEAWAGHDGVSVLQLEQDYQVAIQHLAEIEKALKQLRIGGDN